MDDEKRNNEIWYCNYFKIIVTNGDVKLIDKNKIQKLLLKTKICCVDSIGCCSLTGD